jgi:hypothetical protein
MNITKQNISDVKPYTTDFQALHCNHEVREISEIKTFLLEECIHCLDPLINNKKLYIYDCNHIMHGECFEKLQKLKQIQGTCIKCTQQIINISIYENSEELEKAEVLTCTDDECHKSRLQERRIPFNLIESCFINNNQLVQKQLDQNQLDQEQLFEISQNIAPALNEDEKVRLLKIITSDTNKKQQLINYVESIGIPLDVSSILIEDNNLPTTSSVIPETFISSSSATIGNADTTAEIPESTSILNTSQQQSATNYVGAHSNYGSTIRLRPQTEEINRSTNNLVEREERISVFRRLKRIFLCKK